MPDGGHPAGADGGGRDALPLHDPDRLAESQRRVGGGEVVDLTRLTAVDPTSRPAEVVDLSRLDDLGSTPQAKAAVSLEQVLALAADGQSAQGAIRARRATTGSATGRSGAHGSSGAGRPADTGSSDAGPPAGSAGSTAATARPVDGSGIGPPSPPRPGRRRRAGTPDRAGDAPETLGPQPTEPGDDQPGDSERPRGSRRTGRGRAGSFDRPRRAAGEPVPELEDPEQAARQICLTALTGAARTRAQLADLLAAREIPAEAAEVVLDRFVEVGLVDDAAFAAAWVSSRQAGRGLSRRALAQELRAKGVDPEIASVALEAVDPQDEWDTARALVARKVPGMRRLDSVTATRRLTGMLARKGYGTGLAGWVVREALAADGAAEDAAAEADDGPPEPTGPGADGWSRRRPSGPADADGSVEPVVQRGLWSGRPLDEPAGTEVGEGLTVEGFARDRLARRPGSSRDR